MSEFRHGYSQRIIAETQGAIGATCEIELQQTITYWKVAIDGDAVYVNEDPACCVAFLEGAKWIMDNSEDVKSAQLRMERAMEKAASELRCV